MTNKLSTQVTGALREWETASTNAMDVHEYVGGGVLVDNKAILVGREFVITAVKRNQSDRVRRADANGVITPGTFVSVSCVLREPLLVDSEEVTAMVFNDGGSGIEPVIRRHLERVAPDDLSAFDAFQPVELRPGLHCKHGLRPSHYIAKLGDGSEAEATTWYLD